MQKNKTTSLSKNKLFQATIIVSIILLSFTIYLSQVNNQTAKAATSMNMTGTIVITDHPLNTMDYKAQIYLPSTNCAGEINYCYSDGTTANSLCKTTPIIHNIGNKYDLILNTPQAITQISLSYECVPQNNGPITGTIIISDQLLNTKDYQAITYLPKNNCNGIVNYCFTDGTTKNSYCRSSLLIHDTGNKYNISLPPEKTKNTAAALCNWKESLKKEITQTGPYIDTTLSCNTQNAGLGYSGIFYCGENNICDPDIYACYKMDGGSLFCGMDIDDELIMSCISQNKGILDLNKRFAYPPNSKFISICSAWKWKGHATIEDKIGLPEPATHISVSYECPA